jgi:acyl carrier protein
MERAEILRDLKSMMGEYMAKEDKVNLEHITDDTNLMTDLNMDSIDLVDIVIQVENKYGIEIKNEAISGLNTLGKCLDAIESRLAEKEKTS